MKDAILQLVPVKPEYEAAACPIATDRKLTPLEIKELKRALAALIIGGC
jgi:hypothetical protein